MRPKLLLRCGAALGPRSRAPVARTFAPSSWGLLGAAWSRGFATEDADRVLQAAPGGLWGRFVHWAYRTFGSSLYPPHNSICNCGVDMGVLIPKPEFVTSIDKIEPKSREWRMQLYGAALYWHMATVPGERASDAHDMLRDKDVLEVACMRGGGARYLVEVAAPKRYVATDNVQEHIDTCKSSYPDVPGLEFELADAMRLQDRYPAESFDFVLCIQAAAQFPCLRTFTREAYHVLRPGGRLLLADGFKRDDLKAILDAVDELGMVMDAQSDLSRAVHAVGLCSVPRGVTYLRLVARKVA
mmetsp:Transcript_73559/g.186465  ORF Transcript_73559/g.186465 Transcript_73559/m.186465 type:complete len:299 (+) Transcript_73559:45-941(+)